MTGRSPGDHVCWPFHGLEDYLEAARQYVAEGLDRRELVSLVKVGTYGLKHTVVSDVAQVGPTADRGSVLDELTTPSGWTTSALATAHFDRMTREAVATGYTGLRLLTDVNDLVRGAEGRRQWIRSEHLIDRYTCDHPLTALCGYDVDVLGADVVAEAARVHALTRGAPSPFLLRAADAHGGLALSGEVDVTTADSLYEALMLIGSEIPAQVTVDVAELEFIDHRGLFALDRAAQAVGLFVTLTHVEPLTAWLVDTLELTHVTVGRVS